MSSAIEARPLAGEPKSKVKISPLAGKPAPREMQVELARLERDYFARRPDLGDRNQFVSFGTGGHRRSSLNGTFTEAHVLAITQAICDYRSGQALANREELGSILPADGGIAKKCYRGLLKLAST
jgi:phosphoglucomutase